MHRLESLIEDARRQLDLCNSCRYCEGYCAVFPALERVPGLTDGKIVFLSNLCHDCRACYQACMYTAPHEFGIDIPSALSQVRTAGYESLVWPSFIARAARHSAWVKAGAFAVGLAIAAGVAAISGGGGFSTATEGSGAFYRVMPSLAMSLLYLGIGVGALALLAVGFVQFWEIARVGREAPVSWRAASRASWHAAKLRYLGGGGGGCYYPDMAVPTVHRRWLHVILVAGFALAFGASVSAAIEQHIIGEDPPYPILSLPVILGICGGAGLVVGGFGLAYLKWRAANRREGGEPEGDYLFTGALEAVTITGIFLLVFRGTDVMPSLLLVHLGSVGALYILMPYTKFIHAVHRLAALVLDAACNEAESRDAH